jgi:hypothetical protein
MVTASKVKKLLEGDANTKYFQLVANGKHRKTRIFRFEQEEGLIHKIFGLSYCNNLVMDESYRDDIPMLHRSKKMNI